MFCHYLDRALFETVRKNQVTFRWKDYAHGNKQRLMTLPAGEFLRRDASCCIHSPAASYAFGALALWRIAAAPDCSRTVSKYYLLPNRSLPMRAWVKSRNYRLLGNARSVPARWS